MITIIMTEILETAIEKIPDQDMIISPEIGILEKEIEVIEMIDIEKRDLEKIEIDKRDIEKIEIEKRDIEKIEIEKRDIEKIDIGRIDIGKTDLEMFLGQDMIIIIQIEIPEIDLERLPDQGMILIGMIISRSMNRGTPVLGRMLISLENLEKSKRICSQRKILGDSKE